MLHDFIISRIRAELDYTPNEGQEALLHQWGEFLTDRDPDRLFLLRGYAGTGKTSMVGALVRALNKMEQKTVLLAPTGRAAKVIAAYSGFPAFTIHKYIYRQRQAGEGLFSRSQNMHQHTLFIVDEASMISNIGDGGEFGSGCLLDDLIEYVYSNGTCALMFVGDNAQLPPVGQSTSPALDSSHLAGYGLHVREHTLTDVVRQALQSGILYNATAIRQTLEDQRFGMQPQIQTEGFDDIKKLSGTEFLEELERSYREVGEDETIIVTRTNRRMNLYNQGIRSRILWKEDLLCSSDRIMVTRNNYFFAKQYEGLSFLANGDMLEVLRVRREREMYGFHFADVCLHSLDFNYEIDAIAWLDTLTSESPEANYQMQQQLFNRIAEDYPEIHSRRELIKKILDNEYYNALQIKHAYAVTCHKAQGGQWTRVFIDPGMVSDEHLGEDFYRWYYTALTRATDKVYIIKN